MDSKRIERVCVFCGSSPGIRSAYLDAARELGAVLADEGIGLVYGGAGVGLMGAIADTVLAAGGEVTGVIPEGLSRRELRHQNLSHLEVVGSMHERKARMAELADAFIAMPGGFGTFDELFEIITWAQLGIHAKPIALLNPEDYFGPFLNLVQHATSEGFVPDAAARLLLVESDPRRIVRLLATHHAIAPGPKWLDLSQA